MMTDNDVDEDDGQKEGGGGGQGCLFRNPAERGVMRGLPL